MRLSPDDIIWWQYGFIKLNATIVVTWGLMLFLTIFSRFVTSHLSIQKKRSRWQNFLEIIVIKIEKQIQAIGLAEPRPYLPFLGTLFIFIATANLFIIFPYYEAPTGSLSTTAALAITVFIATPLFGISEQNLGAYLKKYLQPTFIMLPFNIISELTRTLALAMRLFGNIMSGTMTVAIMISVIPWIFPVIMRILGLITGMIQAYIFAILATVYIAAATKRQKEIKLDATTNE